MCLACRKVRQRKTRAYWQLLAVAILNTDAKIAGRTGQIRLFWTVFSVSEYPLISIVELHCLSSPRVKGLGELAGEKSRARRAAGRTGRYPAPYGHPHFCNTDTLMLRLACINLCGVGLAIARRATLRTTPDNPKNSFGLRRPISCTGCLSGRCAVHVTEPQRSQNQ
jgi:hypothetical protein